MRVRIIVSDCRHYRSRALLAALIFLASFARTAFAAPSDPIGAASEVDLGGLDFFVRPGFQIEWIYYEPDPTDPNWKRVRPAAGGRPVIIADLDLPGEQKKILPPLLPQKAQKYCAMTVFEAKPGLLESSSGVGIYFEDIGRNWEVYLNGSIIKSEVYLDRTGRILKERAVHGALVTVDKRYLRLGKNILALSIIGEPYDFRTGLSSGGPHIIGDYEKLLGFKSEPIDLMLIGIYVFFALYHLILFALKPTNTPYVLHGFGTLTFAIYLFSRSYIVFDIMPDTAIIRGIELSSLFLFFPLFIAFFDACNRGKVTLFTWIYGGISATMALFAPFIAGEFLLRIWQYAIPVPAIYLLVADLILPVRDYFRRARYASSPAPSFGARLRRFPQESNFWTLVVTVLVVALCVLAAALRLNSRGAFLSAKYGAFLLIMGTATILAHQFNRVNAEFEELNAGLEEKVRARTAALAETMEEQEGLNTRLSQANLRLEDTMSVASRDQRIAVQIQKGFFAGRPPDLEDWDVAFIYRPAQGVSGDFYDFYAEDGRLEGFVLGDVSGRGISPGLITVLSRSVFFKHFRAHRGAPLGKVLEAADAEFSKELKAVDNSLSAALFRIKAGAVEYANADHPDPAFRRAGRARASFLAPEGVSLKGPVLGRGVENAQFRALKFAAAPGDSIFAYTKYLCDALDPEGKPFGGEGILSAYGRAPDGTAAEMLEYILDDWRFHLSGEEVKDNLAMVMIKRK